MTAMQLAALMLALFVAGQASASGDANTTLEYVDTFGSWHVSRVMDRFDDRELARVAATRIGEHGDLRYICSHHTVDTLYFEIRADDSFDKSIGRDSLIDFEWINVKIKVDDGEIVQMQGAGPHLLAFQEKEIKLVSDLFKAGNEARIRTEQREKRFTFVVDLIGFTRAAEWVEEACPNPLLFGP